ncbi:MAG: hypothetical protein ACTSRU_19980 [Candidatus Hodarchaeales archaeon]
MRKDIETALSKWFNTGLLVMLLGGIGMVISIHMESLFQIIFFFGLFINGSILMVGMLIAAVIAEIEDKIGNKEDKIGNKEDKIGNKEDKIGNDSEEN